MRCLALFLILPCWLSAQRSSETKTYVFDGEGRRSLWTSSQSRNGLSAENAAGVNGGVAPLEQVEERIVSDSGGVRVVERIVRRSDANGRPLPAERVVVEETRQPDGALSIANTVYRSDLNGRMALAERTLTSIRTQGESTQTVTTLERPDLSGRFEVVERKQAVTSKQRNTSETNETVQRKDANNRFSDAARNVLRQYTQNGQVVEQRDEYENASTGAMQLTRQTLSRTVKNADGSELRQVDVFGSAAPGRPAQPGQLQLRERQIVEKKAVPGGVVETLSIQRPSVTDSRQLGAAVRVSEKVCQGDCTPPAASAPAAKN